MTTTQPTMPLRELAKEYADGRIDHQTYRRRRTRLINELAAYVPPASHRLSNQGASARPEIKPSQVKLHNNRKLLRGLLSAFIFLLISGLLAFVIYKYPELVKDLRTIFSFEAPLTEQMVTPPQDPPNLLEADPIKSFVAANDWTPAKRRRLLQQWDLLSADEKYTYSSTTWFLTFSSKLRTLIKAERKLAGGATSAEVNSLLAFATHFGLNFKPVVRKTLSNPTLE